MTKQTLIIIGISVGVIIIGLTLFFLFNDTGADSDTSEEKGFFSFIFPGSDDKEPTSTFFPSTNGTLAEERVSAATTGQPTRNLIQLTEVPVIGVVYNENSKKVQYFEKSTGNLYEIDPQGTNKKRITNTTIQRIFDALWSKDASKTIIRYIDTDSKNVDLIRTFLVFSLATSSTEGIFLPTNTVVSVLSPIENKIFYLSGEETLTGTLATDENKNKQNIFFSPFSSFVLGWPQKNIITFSSKPSYLVDGSFYKLDPVTKSFTKIIGGIKGLSALYSPINNDFIYSESEKQTIITKIYKDEKEIHSTLGIQTLPEKCIFSKLDENKIYCATPRYLYSANYPDDWYQGLFFFSDTITEINTNNGTADIILDQEDLDIINLVINKEETYLFFQNKKDSTLWSLKI
ncbi:MAG: hypothetical protein ABII97_02135 [Patescibacteria group bacterium]